MLSYCIYKLQISRLYVCVIVMVVCYSRVNYELNCYIGDIQSQWGCFDMGIETRERLFGPDKQQCVAQCHSHSSDYLHASHFHFQFHYHLCILHYPTCPSFTCNETAAKDCLSMKGRDTTSSVIHSCSQAVIPVCPRGVDAFLPSLSFPLHNTRL